MSSGPGPIPERWINCPRKATKLVRDKFLAFKTPLAPKFDPQVPEESRFPPEMLLESTKNYSKNRLGLWIDLTNTSRYYDCNVVKQYYDDGKAIGYMKLDCKGRGEAPNEEQTRTFIKLCQNFIKKHPLEIIGVHCTHGFNRTGFLIAAYLVEEYDLSVAAAIQEFAIARPPGIYKGDYIKELFRRYDDVEDAPNPPIRPSWCFDDYQNGHSSSFSGASDNEDDDGVRQPGSKFKHGNSSGKNKKRRQGTKNPTFMAGVPGVEPVTDPELLNELRHLTQQMCHTEDISFPGSQPVSMTHQNLIYLKENPYMVSWKADGTRYMMLITDNNCVYFIDRNNDYFQVHGLTFVHRKDITQPLTNTLMDGEMVIDKFQGQDIPRYLIYDIIYVNNMDVSAMRFSPERIKVIEADVIRPRHQAIIQGHIDKLSEPFSVRLKDFYPINKTKSFLSQKFSRQLTHEPDGLIFQPSNDHYKPGQCPEVLKWKPSTLNSIDFRVKIGKEEGVGIISKKVIYLYVGSLHEPFAKMNYKKHLEQYNNKIIECKFENGQWVFMRERTDKTFPNSFQTATSVMESITRPVTKEHLLQFIEMHVDRNLMPPPSGFRS